jgi:hypothetical protein
LEAEEEHLEKAVYRRQQLVLQFKLQDAIALAEKRKNRELKDFNAVLAATKEAELGGVDPEFLEKGNDKAEQVRLNLLPGIIEELEMAIEGVKPEEVEDALERAIVVGANDDIVDRANKRITRLRRKAGA